MKSYEHVMSVVVLSVMARCASGRQYVHSGLENMCFLIPQALDEIRPSRISRRLKYLGQLKTSRGSLHSIDTTCSSA